MNTHTETMSPDELLSDLQWIADWASKTTPLGGEAVFDTARRARTAVAALIERNAELEAERSRDNNIIRSHASQILRMSAERDALAERVKALEYGLARLASSVSSVNSGKESAIVRDGFRGYYQTEDWVLWILREEIPAAQNLLAHAEARNG